MQQRQTRSIRSDRVGPGYQSYYSNAPLKSRVWRSWRLRIILTSVVIGCVFVLWLLRVKTISVTGTDDPPRAETIVREQLARHPLWKSLVLLPSDNLGRNVQARLADKTSELDIRKNWTERSLEIEFKGRNPSILWQTGGQIYSLDQAGKIIQALAQRSALPLVIDNSNVAVTLNEQVAPVRFVDFVVRLEQELKHLGGPAMVQARVGDTTAELQVETNAGFYIRFDTSREATEQLSALQAVISESKTKNTSIKQYVDLRIPFKAYYR